MINTNIAGTIKFQLEIISRGGQTINSFWVTYDITCGP
jgi:hypothetical protein